MMYTVVLRISEREAERRPSADAELRKVVDAPRRAVPYHALPCRAMSSRPNGTGRERQRVFASWRHNRRQPKPIRSIDRSIGSPLWRRSPVGAAKGRSDATLLVACPAPLVACRATRMPRGSAWSVSCLLPSYHLLAHICAGTGPHLRRDRGFRPGRRAMPRVTPRATPPTGRVVCLHCGRQRRRCGDVPCDRPFRSIA
jgi:hypothetical protein